MFQAKQVDISGIGPCCADFTVEYALLVKDKFYVAYYNEHHCITVASRAEEETTWQISYPTGEWLADKNRYMHQTEFDSHNYLTLAMDKQGHLHLSGNMHKDKMVWFRSTRPYDIHSLAQGTMTGIREESATYPLFFRVLTANYFSAIATERAATAMIFITAGTRPNSAGKDCWNSRC